MWSTDKSHVCDVRLGVLINSEMGKTIEMQRTPDTEYSKTFYAQKLNAAGVVV